jgi:hypothetical protein
MDGVPPSRGAPRVIALDGRGPDYAYRGTVSRRQLISLA